MSNIFEISKKGGVAVEGEWAERRANLFWGYQKGGVSNKVLWSGEGTWTPNIINLYVSKSDGVTKMEVDPNTLTLMAVPLHTIRVFI